MYNLLITGDESAWNSSEYEFDKSRFGEYTLLKRQIPLLPTDVEELKSIPSLFMHEGKEGKAKIGFIKELKERRTTILIEIEFIKINANKLTNQKIWDIRNRLDIGDFEFMRTHWAIKDEDLFKILCDQKLISKIQYKKLEKGFSSPIDNIIPEHTKKLDSIHVRQAWEKALSRRAKDTTGAITSARTLLETVCKNILDATGGLYDDKTDLPKLFNLVTKRLKIAPTQDTEQSINQIATGCISVVHGVGTLRNKLGDAHGKGGNSSISVHDHHAHLAVNLAGSLALYLIETFEITKE